MFMLHICAVWPHWEWFGKIEKSDGFAGVVEQRWCCGSSCVSGRKLFMSKNIDQTVLDHFEFNLSLHGNPLLKTQ